MESKDVNIMLVMPKVDCGYQDWILPPVGIMYVSSALKQAGFTVYNVNLNLETEPVYEVLKREILNNDIDMIATGGLVVNYHVIKKIIDVAKMIKSDILTCVGGSLVTFSAEAVMRGIQSADIGMIGEGEITACEIAESIRQGNLEQNLQKVKGIIFREGNGELVLTPKREEIFDIDSIPWPDYDGFNYWEMVKKYGNNEEMGIVSAPLTTSRSCPFRCTFCSKSGGEKYRQRTLESIFEELDWLVTKYKVNHLFLNDELFANDNERIKEFCSRIKKYDVKWFVSLRVSRHITKELLDMMKSSGCIQILYGLESGDDTVLKSMRKGITVKEIERVVRLTAEAGFQVRGNFIFGDPMETMETVNNTIKFIENNKDVFTSVALSPIILFPGSKLYNDAIVSGVIDDELKFIEDECPIKNVSSMTDDEYFVMVNSILPKAKISLNAVENIRSGEEFCAIPDNKSYRFKSKCLGCAYENKFYISNTEAIMRANQYICSECGAEYNVSITYEFAQLLYASMKKICAHYKVALWGCGQNMSVISEYAKGFDELKFVLIDTDVMKIGKKGIGAKLINSPDVINREQIEFVVDMTSVRRVEVENRVRREFPEVEYVYSMFDIPLSEQLIKL